MTGPGTFTQCHGNTMEQLHEKTIGDRTEIPSEWFLHCYFEAAANLAAGLNEMLLQSHRGLLRVIPGHAAQSGRDVYLMG